MRSKAYPPVIASATLSNAPSIYPFSKNTHGTPARKNISPH
jgi:hypothetical protein